MPATNATLPDNWYGEGEEPGVQLWIGSVAPYYCQNNGAPGDDLSADGIWVGVSSAVNGAPTTKTTGLKFAVQYPDLGGVEPRMDDGAGNAASWTSIDSPSSPYYQSGTADGNWALQTAYEVTIQRYPMPFGPYPLNKTTDSTPYPAADGDIIVVTTGSDVLAGNIGDGGVPYDNLDTRSFNLIFYSTGSNNVNDLVQSIPENAAPGINTQLTNYNSTSRNNFVINSEGLFAFVAIPADSIPNALKWWPITWDVQSPNNVRTIHSKNAS